MARLSVSGLTIHELDVDCEVLLSPDFVQLTLMIWDLESRFIYTSGLVICSRIDGCNFVTCWT